MGALSIKSNPRTLPSVPLSRFIRFTRSSLMHTKYRYTFHFAIPLPRPRFLSPSSDAPFYTTSPHADGTSFVQHSTAAYGSFIHTPLSVRDAIIHLHEQELHSLLLRCYSSVTCQPARVLRYQTNKCIPPTGPSRSAACRTQPAYQKSRQ